MLSPVSRQASFSALNKTTALITAVFTLLIASSLWWNIYNEINKNKELAKNEARATFNKDIAFRSWATKHGGVYVPETEDTPPNPYLSHIPERDIRLPSGKRMTLMNPAYMLRQVMTEYSELYGVRGRITSLKAFNPINTPDEWEKKALKSFEAGVKEVFEFIDINGEPYLRLMQPAIVKEGCLKCHLHQGYKEGDIRGGIGVSLPMKPYLIHEKRTIVKLVISHAAIWFLGLAAIGFFFTGARRDIVEQIIAVEKIRETDDFLNKIIENIPNMIFLKDAEELRFVRFNKAGEGILGYRREDLYGKNDYDFFPREQADFFTGKDREVLNSKKLLDIPEETIETRHQGKRIFHTKKIPIDDEQGNPKFLMGISEDITERKRAEEELMKYKDHLEEMVKERTKELEEKILEIERMNKLFVGRELKMVELKEKIKELEKLTGEQQG